MSHDIVDKSINTKALSALHRVDQMSCKSQESLYACPLCVCLSFADLENRSLQWIPKEVQC